MKRKVQGLFASVVCALILCACVPARAATATLQVDAFNGASGFVDMACLVTLTGTSSVRETVDFHVGLVGTWTTSWSGISVGQGGAGDHRYPEDTTLWFRAQWFPSAQTGTFDVWAVAHGYTVNPPDHISWDASTGDHYYSYNG